MSEDRGARDSKLRARQEEARRLAYLEAMGIDVWVPRERAAWDSDSDAREGPGFPPSFQSESALEQRSGRSDRGLEPEGDRPSAARNAPAPSSGQHAEDPVSELGWDALRDRVSSCTLCDLHTTRTQTVFGVGDLNADWLFVGEAPGAEEDRRGEPFVGRAGQLLNNMLRALGLSREQVYIANVLKCRPPKNRDPQPEESDCCRPYLRRQIELIRPRIIVVLGRVAAQDLLETDTPIGKLRGRKYVYADTDVPLVVTYHPAYLLRSPGEKRKAWQDLLLAQQSVVTG